MATKLSAFDTFRRASIHPILWLVAGIFTVGTIGFYLYWIMVWGIVNGKLLLNSWGWNFAISTIQDIFFVNCIRCIIFYWIGRQSIRPQLLHIRQYLQTIAIELQQSSSSSINTTNTPFFSNKSNKSKSRKRMTSSIRRRTSQINQTSFVTFSMIQSLSPTCRAVRAYAHSSSSSSSNNALHNLTRFQQLLYYFDDYDYRQCQQKVHDRLGTWIGLFFGFLPIILFLFGNQLTDTILDIVLPTICSRYIIINSVLSNRFQLALFILNVLVVLIFLRQTRIRAYVSRRSQWLSQYYEYYHRHQIVKYSDPMIQRHLLDEYLSLRRSWIGIMWKFFYVLSDPFVWIIDELQDCLNTVFFKKKIHEKMQETRWRDMNRLAFFAPHTMKHNFLKYHPIWTQVLDSQADDDDDAQKDDAVVVDDDDYRQLLPDGDSYLHSQQQQRQLHHHNRTISTRLLRDLHLFDWYEALSQEQISVQRC
jgi:hypothetical protein